MTWTDLIPTSLLHLGAMILLLAIVLVYVDVPGKGVPWDKVGAWFSIVGGFGVGGAATGSLGGLFSSLGDGTLTVAQKVTAWAFGVAVGGAIVVALSLWAYSRAQGKGLATKSKLKSLFVVGFLAIAGSVIAALPGIYGWADNGVAWGGSELISIFS